MNQQRHRVGALLSLCLLAALAGCGEHRSVLAPKLTPSGDSPAVTVSAVRLASVSPTLSRYRVSWQAAGSVDHFIYTRDPGAADQVDARWVSTRETSILIDAPVAPSGMVPTRGVAWPSASVLVRAVDRSGRLSPLGGISIVNGNIAPTVQILSPVPNAFTPVQVPPNVTISWTGHDDDGGDIYYPVQNKWKLLGPLSDFPVPLAVSNPDSLRRRYEPDGYADWDSTGAGPSGFVRLQNLIPGVDYLFCVAVRDQQGAWNQVFSLTTNLLRMRPALTGGPLISMFGSLFSYTYASPGYLLDPSRQVPVSLPPGAATTVNWSATPPSGAVMNAYRWSLDIDDVSDETPRIDEATDVHHWSAWNLQATAATVGPFGPGETHILYIDARDSYGLRSLGMVRFTTVAEPSGRELLVVDDTRFQVDQRSAGTACMNAPIGRWPTAAELDTFLFARGGFQWKCYPTGATSTPGLFASYEFDTIGTRSLSGGTIPLETLLQYRHVVWLTDQAGASNTALPGQAVAPMSFLRFMSAPGRQNTLAAYVAGGGNLWLAGGGAADASMITWDKANNNAIQPAPGLTFSNWNGELVPGRFPYDVGGWRSEIKVTNGPLAIARNLGRFTGQGSIYDGLPAGMHARTSVTDPYPPGRSVSAGNYWYTSFALEYLSQPNDVTDGGDPPLDTLYSATGATLVQPGFNPANVCMTAFHPPGSAPVLFTGFTLWEFQRADTKSLVDFVLQNLWGMGPATPHDDTPPPAPPIKRGPVAGPIFYPAVIANPRGDGRQR